MKPAPFFLLLLLLAGCSEAFDPFAESDQTFALYGFLDARKNTQFVRLQRITEQTGALGTVDARVTSTDLGTGETLVWRDSLVQLEQGLSGTVFLADFRPAAGRTYRIDATRLDATGLGDSAQTTAIVRFPTEPPLRAEEPVSFNTTVSQLLTVGGLGSPGDVVVTYTVRLAGSEDAVRFDVGYEVEEPEAPGSGFGVFVELSRDVGVIAASFETDAEIELLGLEVSYDLVNERAAPITGGPGLFGVAARFTSGWTLAPRFVAALGLVDAQGAE